MCMYVFVIKGIKDGKHADRLAEMKDEDKRQGEPEEGILLPEGPAPDQEFSLSEVIDLTANSIPNGIECFSCNNKLNPC